VIDQGQHCRESKDSMGAVAFDAYHVPVPEGPRCEIAGCGLSRAPITPVSPRSPDVLKLGGREVDAAYMAGDVLINPRESRGYVPETRDSADGSCSLDQAAELAALVELEACWENLRIAGSRPPEPHPAARELHGRQKAYESFRVKLAAYNKLYAPVHIPELLLNTPTRLGVWCRTMRDLFLRVEHDARIVCPVQLIEKAFRRADQLATKGNTGLVNRPASTGTIQEAIHELEGLRLWCEERVGILQANDRGCESTLAPHVEVG
jgi:hypothetical protein